VDGSVRDADTYVGETDTAKEQNGRTVFESTLKRPLDKRPREKNDNPGDIGGFIGPWGGYVDEVKVSKPSEVRYCCLHPCVSKLYKFCLGRSSRIRRNFGQKTEKRQEG
jgi:pre-mRNA-processing factor 17